MKGNFFRSLLIDHAFNRNLEMKISPQYFQTNIFKYYKISLFWEYFC